MTKPMRWCTLLLTLIFLLPILPQNTAQAAGRQYFNDVPETAWYAEAVNALAREELIGGREDGGFHPGDYITRAEFLRLLAAISGSDAKAESYLISCYTDVNPDGWYAPYLSWALQEKLLGGTSATTFSPDAVVDREQMALILYRFHRHVMGYRMEEGETTLFSDTKKISSWAKKAALACGNAGLMSGYEDGAFRPKNRATRAEAAQLLYNYLLSYGTTPRGCSNRDLRYIMHGGGDIDGQYENSNSLNSVNECVRNGNFTMEIDLSWTSDGELVCTHHLDDPTITREQFMSTTLPGGLLPMDLETLANFLRGHPNVHIVPDFKSDNLDGLRKISEQCSDILDRFLPYVMHLSDYEEIRSMGFPNLVLTTYQMTAAEKNEVEKNVTFAAQHDFTAIAIPYEQGNTLQYLQAAKQQCVPVVLDTVNAVKTMETYVQKGADGFFTNSQTVKAERFAHWGF